MSFAVESIIRDEHIAACWGLRSKGILCLLCCLVVSEVVHCRKVQNPFRLVEERLGPFFTLNPLVIEWNLNLVLHRLRWKQLSIARGPELVRMIFAQAFHGLAAEGFPELIRQSAIRVFHVRRRVHIFLRREFFTQRLSSLLDFFLQPISSLARDKLHASVSRDTPTLELFHLHGLHDEVSPVSIGVTITFPHLTDWVLVLA
mmetsp:Transcript_28995/g.52546  ORF Transcript_28995/g.52546 Transcript_28995/m.52546 type:complete len:202 (+) Transcript_28995:1233-1838(+)